MRRAFALAVSVACCSVAAACAGHASGAGTDAAGKVDAARADAAPVDARAGDASQAASCPAPTWTQDGAPACNHQVGLTGPLPPCTAAWPCHLLGKTITTPYSAPAECKTSMANHPTFDDGPPRTWTDPVTGKTRAACVYVPPAAGPKHRLPLLVYVHGSGGSATNVYGTLLRQKADSFVLSGDASRPGFILAAPQAGNVHWPGASNFDGAHEDTFFRDLGAPSCNADIRNLDRLIDDLVAGGAVDPKRIYITGHSNGAVFAHLYAIARHDTPTPGGNRIAAASTYAGYDPFNAFSDTDDGCVLDPYPTSTVPIEQIHRNCDALVACDAAQRLKFGLPPGDDVETFMNTTLPGPIGDPNTGDIIIDAAAKQVTACAAAAVCTQARGVLNHLYWPDGINDGSGTDWEPTMLAYLRDHPLP